MKFDYKYWVHYNYIVQKITLWGGGAMVKNSTPQCGNVGCLS